MYMVKNTGRLHLHAVLSLVLLLILAGTAWAYLLVKLDETLHIPDTGMTYELAAGTGVSEMVRDLHRLGLIESPVYLQIFARLSASSGQIKAGEYLLRADMNQRDLLRVMREGRVNQRQFTIIEGWTLHRIRKELALADGLRHITAEWSDAEIGRRLNVAQPHVEGWFFPDTYHYIRGSTDLSLLEDSFRRMQTLLQREWLNRASNLPYQDSYEALVIASLIEKETGLPADRDKIAAVFLSRWQKKIRLQSDPTVIYGLGAAFDGDLHRSDLQNRTPYNTYTSLGLPPTPICSPGQQAIHAALHPADITSLYFVSRKDGSSQFSDTLEEHNRAVKQYQLDHKP